MRIQGVPDLGPGLRLHLNENTGGCSPRVVEAVRSFDGPRLSLYPDFKDAVLETAAYLGVDPDQIVLTNGLDEGILLTSIGQGVHAGGPSLVLYEVVLDLPDGFYLRFSASAPADARDEWLPVFDRMAATLRLVGEP